MKNKPIKIWGLWDKQREIYIHPFYQTRKQVSDRFEKKIADTLVMFKKETGREFKGSIRKMFIIKSMDIE